MSKTNLKQRIEDLASSTSSDQAVVACKEALAKYAEYASFILPTHLSEQFEVSVSETLIEKLEGIKDEATANFLMVEKRIVGMNNMGVRKAIAALNDSDMKNSPATVYVLEHLKKLQHLPEWMVVENTIQSLSKFEWHSLVKEHLNIMKANFEKYAEDIKIYQAVDEAKKSTSNFIMSGLEGEINGYLNTRTTTSRTKLMESLGKHLYDQNVRSVYNVIADTAKNFQLAANGREATVAKIYSPVIINEDNEVFSVHGKAYVKSGSNMRPLNEEERKVLPSYFDWMSSFLSQPNVEVSEGKIKIYSRDKKVEIIEEDEVLSITINGKTVSINEFNNIYLKAGIFNMQEKEVINAVHQLVEKWNLIFELDFAKSIQPTGMPNRRVDIFNLGEKIHVNKVDYLMKENLFHEDCNAVQAKNLVLEFAHYDITNAFSSMLNEKEAELRKLDDSKKKVLETITYLEERKNLLSSVDDEDVLESDEYKEVLSLIESELNSVKSIYSEINNRQRELTTLEEGLGANVGDEVEYLKKKQ
jgi:hypothetical protein